MDKRLNIQHKDLAAGRWAKLSLLEQMAHIGSEVSRALNWQNKANAELSQKAVVRALELFDLTLDCQLGFARLKEVARAREVLVDYFYGTNEFKSTEILWRKYFDHFLYALRNKGKNDK